MKTKEERSCLFKNDSRRDLKTCKRIDLIKMPEHGYMTGMIGDSSHWTIYHNEYTSCVMGSSIFWKKISHESVTFKGGKLYGSKSAMLYSRAAAVLGLEWVNYKWVPYLIVSNKTLWQMVFNKKITNPEMLAKKYSKLYFKGVYSYRNLKGYFIHHKGISLYDIYHYTSNPDLFLERMNRGEYQLDIIFDVIKYCSYTNSKLNPAWSDRRLLEYHQKQIEEDLKAEAANKSTDNIIEPITIDGLSCILNERDAFMESQLQHNCVYRCYWHQIKEGKYLVFKGNLCNKRITLGIRTVPTLNTYKIQFEQVHTIYNGSLDVPEYNMVIEWVNQNEKTLIEIAKAINDKRKLIEKDIVEDNTIPWNEEPPF